MELTLCHDCVQPFFDDKNYLIDRQETDPCDNECFICGRHGCNYDIEKRKKVWYGNHQQEDRGAKTL